MTAKSKPPPSFGNPETRQMVADWLAGETVGTPIAGDPNLRQIHRDPSGWSMWQYLNKAKPQTMKTKKLAKALSKAQANPAGQLDRIQRPSKVQVRQKLLDLVEAGRGPLADNGLSVSQLFEEDQETGGRVLVTRLMHKSGQHLESRLRLLEVQDYHALGSATTYSRKYALASLLNLVAQDDNDDDDGEAAMQSGTKQSPGAGAKARPGRKPKAPPTTDNEKWVAALAIIDATDGARAFFEAKDIDCRELLPQVVDQILKEGEAGMAKKVEQWRKEIAKAEKAEAKEAAAKKS